MMRIVAAVCLDAMLGSWMPHVHLDGHDDTHAFATPFDVATTPVARISADDAHDEHSSRSTAAESGCAVCRSQNDRKCDRARPTGARPPAGPSVRPGGRLVVALPAPHALGLHPTRAPPIA